MTNHVTGCLEYLKESSSVFHAVDQIWKMLEKEGFQLLSEGEVWNLVKGNKYAVIRNMSSIIAFTIGKDMNEIAFNMTASHSDSPLFKLKENHEIKQGNYLKMAMEGYGGLILPSWLDRPLSIAGRVCVKNDHGFEIRMYDAKRDLCSICNVPIHMNREINSGFKYNLAVDLVPLFGDGEDEKGSLKRMIAQDLDVKEEDILNMDLYIYNRTPYSVWGTRNQYFSSPKIDNLECAYTTLQGLIQAENTKRVNLYACFDNEEVGSQTKQGAGSTFLADVCERIAEALGYDKMQLKAGYHHSMMLSADNAHAVHPNHPELFDNNNGVYMNKGVVIKGNANQRYTSDGISSAIFASICEKNQIPVQYYFNRSDMPGGSTLGSIAMGGVSVKCVDIGLAQLAMHSSYETAGVKDIDYMIQACKAFYESNLKDHDDSIELC